MIRLYDEGDITFDTTFISHIEFIFRFAIYSNFAIRIPILLHVKFTVNLYPALLSLKRDNVHSSVDKTKPNKTTGEKREKGYQLTVILSS